MRLETHVFLCLNSGSPSCSPPPLSSKPSPPPLPLPLHQFNNGYVSLCSFDINTKDIVKVVEQYPFDLAEFLVQTCLELVCIHSWVANETHIFNPTNNYSLPLPTLDRYSSPNYYKSSDVALGYVASTNEYKVLCVTTVCNRTYQHLGCFADIFTLGTNKCWRDVEDPPDLHGFSTLVNETVCWLGAEAISRFDLAKEEWSLLLHLPFMPKETNSHLTELGGHLCYVDTGGYGTKYFDIWMLQNYDNNSWSKKYHIDLTLIDLGTDDALTYVRVLTIDKDGMLLMFLPSPEGKLVYYDTSSGNIEVFHMRDKLGVGDEYHIREPTFYLDSFLPPEDQF